MVELVVFFRCQSAIVKLLTSDATSLMLTLNAQVMEQFLDKRIALNPITLVALLAYYTLVFNARLTVNTISALCAHFGIAYELVADAAIVPLFIVII